MATVTKAKRRKKATTPGKVWLSLSIMDRTEYVVTDAHDHDLLIAMVHTSQSTPKERALAIAREIATRPERAGSVDVLDLRRNRGDTRPVPRWAYNLTLLEVDGTGESVHPTPYCPSLLAALLRKHFAVHCPKVDLSVYRDAVLAPYGPAKGESDGDHHFDLTTAEVY